MMKKETYIKISQEYAVPFNEILAIGDRYQVDIKPLEELGGTGIQISNTDDVNKIIVELLQQ